MPEDTFDWTGGDRMDDPGFKDFLQRGRGRPGRPGVGPGGGFGGFGGFSPTGFSSFNPTPTQPIRRFVTGGAQWGGMPFTMNNMGQMPMMPLPQMQTLPAQQKQMGGMGGMRGLASQRASSSRPAGADGSVSPETFGGGMGGLIRFMQWAKDQKNAGTLGQPAGNADNPWGTQNWGELQRWLINAFGSQGAFSPMGNPRITEEIMRRANEMGSGASSRARNAASLGGLDPAAAASYGLQYGLRGQSDAARAGSDAVAQQLMGQQALGQQALMGFINPNQQAFSNNWLQQRAPGQGGSGWGDLLGGALGIGLGGWLSPGGLFPGRSG